MARLSEQELAEILARHVDPFNCCPPRAHEDNRKLLAELDWVTAERDAWKARYYRMAEALSKARPAEPYYDGDTGCISVVGGKVPAGTGESCIWPGCEDTAVKGWHCERHHRQFIRKQEPR